MNRFSKNFAKGAVLLFCVLAFCSVAISGVEKEINREFQVSPGGMLSLESDIGSIKVVSGSGSVITVSVRMEARTSSEEKAEQLFDDFIIEFEQDGNNLNILAEYDGRRSLRSFFGSRRNHLKIEFIITVPSQYNVYLKTSGGSIHVGNLEGHVTAKSSGGSLVFDNIEGEVDGKTSGGNIELTSCTGSAEVKTSGGSILIGRVDGDVVAKTSGGNIKVEEVLGTIDARTSGGSVMARISRQPQNDCRLTTSGGNVTVYLAEDVNLNINAKTSGGRVKTTFPMKVSGSITKRSIDVSLNDGGPELYLRTSGGSIYLKSL